MLSESFGRYELVEQIGTGGMAEVYLAKSIGAEGLEKDLVIKKILPEYAENDRFVDMFISEADIAVGLNHPNIVQIYDFGKVDDDYFLAMEFVDGPDLGDLLDACRTADKPMTIGDSIYIGIEVAKGLHYAHQRTDQYGDPLEIVHRDISPQNILVSRDGAVKIVDFGIAKATSVADNEPDVVKGKFRYMSPEQASGGEIDHRSDLFSLGVVLFEMICGRALFEQSTTSETLSLVKSAVVPDISNLNRDVPERLEHLLYKVLERDPDDRIQSARELQVELTKVLYDLGEIHDSMTLSRYIDDVSAHLEEKDTGTTGTGSGTKRTSVLDTIAVSTSAAGTREADASDSAETVFQEQPEPEGMPPPMAARQRKEAVFIHGEISGLLELKSVIDEHHTWIQVLEEYTRIVDSITFKNDGRVHHVDETGFLILLGIPVSSENDAVRGTRVAMDLQEAVSGMNLSLETPIRLSIGVAVGDVLVEQEDRSQGPRYNWSFYGSSYEYAEELGKMAMANETLLSPQVFRRVRRDFECEAVSENRSADEDEPPSAFRLVGPKSPGDRIQEVRRSYYSFYGREIPLKILREQFRRTVLDEQAAGLLFVGDQGVGKSTLVEEFLSGLDTRDVRVVRGVATTMDRDVPLGSLAELFVELMRLGDPEDLRQLRDTLETRIDALFPDVDDTERELLHHSLGSLFDVTFPPGQFSDLNREERRMRIFLSLQRVLRRFAERKPIVLAIDDSHYIDSVSLEFATQFFNSKREYPVFVVFTADSTGRHVESREWQQFMQADHIDVERLEELSRHEAKKLIRDLLRGHGVRSDTLTEDIFRWSGGNPMFIKEVVEVVRDQGQLKDPGESTQIDAVGDQPEWLPSSVEELIAAKIDRLDASLTRILQRVSLLWSPFDGKDVELVIDEDVSDDLEELVRQQFLERADRPQGQQPDTYDPEAVPPQDREYRFCNALTREVAARTLLPEEAAELHKTVVEYLDEHAEDPSVADKAFMARHLEGAGEEDRALDYYLSAADDALEQFGAAESLRLADRALELAEEESRNEFKAQQLRENALSILGETEQAEQTLEQLVDLVFDLGEPGEQVEVLIRFASFHVDHANFEEAREYTQRARKLAEEHGDESGQAESWYSEAGMLMSEGLRDEAYELTEEAIEIYESGSSEKYIRGLAKCQNLKGIILRRAGRHSDALETYERALENAQKVEDTTLTRFLLNNSGLALVYLGEYSEAMDRYQEALEQCRRLGHRKYEGEYYVNLGHAYFLVGRTEEAISTIRKGIYRGRQTGVDADVSNGLISLGLCYLEQGNLEAADRSLHEGLRIADSIPEAYYGVHAMFALAKVRLAAGTAADAQTALVQAEDGIDRAEDADMDWGIPYGRMLEARALNAMGRREKAIEKAREAVDGLEDEGYNPEEVLYHHVQILPDEPEYEEERREAIQRAKRIVIERRDRIDDEDDRKSYLNRGLISQILHVAKLLGRDESSDDVGEIPEPEETDEIDDADQIAADGGTD